MPGRVLLTGWPWRSAVYLLTSPFIALVWVLAAWPLGPLAGVPLGAVERWRLRLVDTVPGPSPHQPTLGTGVRGWLAIRLSEAATRRALVYGIVFVPLSLFDWTVAVTLLGVPIALVATPIFRRSADMSLGDTAGLVLLGVVTLAVVLYLLTAIAGGRAQLARYALIGSRERELDTQIAELTASRSRMSRAFDSQARQLGRDLHDGTQQSLASLVMTLGMLRFELGEGADVPHQLADRAYDEAKRALRDLRDLVHGFRPATLTERGLVAAIEERALAAPLPVHVQCPADRFPPEVESAVYFALCEALTNVLKHSQATSATITIEVVDRIVRATVTDDGVGGADPTDGSGLIGMADRVGAMGGRLYLSSPVGGPTTVMVEVPCES